jgi:hypothetical protein
MDTYRVVSLGIAQWAIERTRDDMTADLLPARYTDASEAAWEVMEITREELRQEQAGRFGQT